jgi:hypothetical protein
VVFTIDFNSIALAGSVTLEIESGALVKWSGTFKVGYYYKLGVVNFGLRRFASLSPYTEEATRPISNVLGGTTLHSRIIIPAEDWYKDVVFRNPVAAPENITAEFVGGITPPHNAKAIVASQFALDGFLYLVASDSAVYVPSK